jgi:alpha-galactosidase
VLGLYDLYERLTNEFPDVLWEGCAGGGGRFDAAMLYYSPQIWCSDNTDAVERLYIQEGTSYGYPASAVGAHVSAVPNHQTGRTTPFGTRGTVAMSGGFGYELDLNKITEEEKAEVRTQIERYHEYYDMIHHGDYYRLTQDSRKYDHTAWQFVAEDKGSTLVSLVQTAPRPCAGPIRVRLKGLDPDASYEVVRTEVFGCEGGRLKNTRRVFPGEALMNGGVVLPVLSGNYPSLQMYLKRV